MNKKKVFIIVVSWLVVLATMLIIARFSLEDNRESTSSSDEIFDSVIKDDSSLTKEEIRTAHRVIRKMAHLGIYMLLGFCLNNAFFVTFDFNVPLNLSLACFFGFSFSIFDEFIIQGNTEGRTPMFSDVLIDLAGLIIGTLLLASFVAFIKIIKKKEISK